MSRGDRRHHSSAPPPITFPASSKFRSKTPRPPRAARGNVTAATHLCTAAAGAAGEAAEGAAERTREEEVILVSSSRGT